MHEKQMHKHNSYITLTQDDKHLAGRYSLDHYDFQCFMKRLRKACSADNDKLLADADLTNYKNAINAISSSNNRLPSGGQIKYYMCGEYGPLHGRPHFHALLFGIDFQDKILYKQTLSGSKLYTSKTLQKLWPNGFSSVGELTFESAAYVARYIMTKRTGDENKKNYEILDLATGEIYIRKKEYNTMSRRPGIGSSWLTKYANDVYTTGKVILRGHQHNPPRYYDKIYKKIDAAAVEEFQYQRMAESLAHYEHQTPERLAVQETVSLARTKRLTRKGPTP